MNNDVELIKRIVRNHQKIYFKSTNVRMNANLLVISCDKYNSNQRDWGIHNILMQSMSKNFNSFRLFARFYNSVHTRHIN